MQAVLLLKKMYEKIARQVGRELAIHGCHITEAQYRYLAAIYDYPLNPAGIADVMASPPSTVSRLYPVMRSMGLIKKKQVSAGDACKNGTFQIEITAKGKKTYEKAKPIVDNVIYLNKKNLLDLAKGFKS